MAGLAEHGEERGFERVDPVGDGADRVGFVEGGSGQGGGGAEES